MACTRGCAGTPICSALDLCCIQFRQDCGKECDGVPDGYSTIQLNVDGELEICSNVGGVCTCEEVCTGNCVTSIVSDNTCVDGGIGADYTIWEADINDGVLTLNGEPRNYSVEETSVILSGVRGGTGHPPTPGISFVDHTTESLVVTNPSPCKDMNVTITVFADLLGSEWTAGPTEWQIQGRLDVGVVNLGFFRSYEGQILPSVDVQEDALVLTYTVTDVIPAGGTSTYDYTLRTRIDQNDGFLDSTWTIVMSAFGST